jgi:hypothetical protein
MPAATTFKTTTEAGARRVAYWTRGHSHSRGPITRLVSPSDVGGLIKPFVFLDYFDIDPKQSENRGNRQAPSGGRSSLVVKHFTEDELVAWAGTPGLI